MAASNSNFSVRLWFFYFTLGVLFITKLWTTQYQDTKLSSGLHDDAWFTWKAEHAYWETEEYTELTYIKEPLFPLYIKTLNDFGIPLRLGNDMAYGFALALLAIAMLKRTGFVSVSLILYATLLFHPYGLAVFTRSVSDALFTILTVLWLIPFLFIFRKESPPKKRWLALWSFIGGLMLITRPEGIWIMASSLLVLAWTFYQHLRNCSWQLKSPTFIIRTLLASFVLFAPSMAIVHKIKSTNQERVGFNAIAEQAEPHYQEALKALMSVKSDQPIRYAFVQLETLQRLGEHSPLTKGVYEKLAGPIGQKWSSYVHTGFHPGPGELGGHFHWAFREAVASLGHYETPEKSQAFYQALTNEVNALLEAGTFEKRWVPSTGLSEVYSPFSGAFIRSMKRVLARSWRLELELQHDDTGVFEPLIDLYNTTTLRSQVSFQNKDALSARLVLRGWIYSSPTPLPLQSINGLQGGSEILVDAITYNRDDVLAGKNPELVGTLEPTFGFYADIENKHLMDSLRFSMVDGSFFDVLISDFEQPGGGYFVQATTNTGNTAEVCVDYNVSVYYSNKLAKLDSFIGFYESTTKNLPYLLTFYFLLLVVIISILHKQFSLHFAAISIILFGIWFLRFLMYAMIDYTAFPGDDLRYLFPTSVFLYALPFLLFALFLNECPKYEEAAN